MQGIYFDLVYHEFNQKKDGQGWAATATIAICRAALFVTYMD
jgi:hypothetical protein